MPSQNDALDDSNDDYIAQLVATEARNSSLRYSTLGVDAYLPKRPTGKAPKPNTRFLRNILRDADSHNAALKRKEEEEARERMRRRLGRHTSPSRHAHRSDSREQSSRSRRDRSSESDYDRSSKRSRRRHERDDESERRESPKRHRHHRRHDDRDRDRPSRRGRDEGDDRHARHRHSRRSRSLSRSRSPHRSASPKRRERCNDNEPAPSHRHDRPQAASRGSDDESDPLEDLIGPLPQSHQAGRNMDSVPSRGRGAYRSSNIDAHFSQDYDPTLDVHLDDDEDNRSGSVPSRRPVAGLMTAEDDWDMALEALRDRARWRQKGAERLRAAGFDDQVIEQWKKNPAFSGSNEQDRVEEVRWAKKGEGREWDRGKVLNEDGTYDVKAPW